jgi:hypothetical protein
VKAHSPGRGFAPIATRAIPVIFSANVLSNDVLNNSINRREEGVDGWMGKTSTRNLIRAKGLNQSGTFLL